MSARLTDGRTLSLNLEACNATSNRAEVDERPGIVTMRVTTDGPPGGDDCSDGITVDLEGPLAGRRLRDGSTGEYVQVMDCAVARSEPGAAGPSARLRHLPLAP